MKLLAQLPNTSDIGKILQNDSAVQKWFGYDLASLIQNIVQLMLILIAVVFFVLLLLGAAQWIVSGGEKEAIGKAQKRITAALIGMALLLSAWAIMKLVEYFFDIDLGIPL